MFTIYIFHFETINYILAAVILIAYTFVYPFCAPNTCFCIQDKANLSWVEFFAGQAEATRMFRYGGFNAAKLDILYMTGNSKCQNPMDLCSDAGMGILG